MNGDHRYLLGRLRHKRRTEIAGGDDVSEVGKTIRESVQLLLNFAAALAAVFVFFRYDAVKKDLDVRLGKIQEAINTTNLEKGQLELQGLKGRKIAVEKRLRVKKLAAENVYKIDLDYSFANKAGVPMEVRGVLAEVYVGTVPQLHSAVAEINSPFVNGDVLWSPVIRKAFVIEGDRTEAIDTQDPNEKDPHVKARQGGGGTGLLNPGEMSNGGLAVMLKTSRSAVLAAYVTGITKLPSDSKPLAWRTSIVDDLDALSRASQPIKAAEQ